MTDAAPIADKAAAPEPTAAPPAAAATPEVAAAPVEKPFTIDLLQSCTARMTHQCWQVYLKFKNNLNRIQTELIRAELTARSDKGLQEIVSLLEEAGVTQKTIRSKTVVSFSATFAQIQAVIKHPQTLLVDAISL